MDQLGQLPLLLIEAVKAIRTQLQRCGNMQEVGCSDTKPRGCLSRQYLRSFERLVRQRSQLKHSVA